MKLDLTRWGPATVLVVVVVAVVVIAGAVVTVVNPETLPFDKYLLALSGAAGASGLLGVGRGLMLKPVAPAPVVNHFAAPPATLLESRTLDFEHSGDPAAIAAKWAGEREDVPKADAGVEITSDGSGADDAEEIAPDVGPREAEGSALDSPAADDALHDIEPDDPETIPPDRGDFEAHANPQVTSA